MAVGKDLDTFKQEAGARFFRDCLAMLNGCIPYTETTTYRGDHSTTPESTETREALASLPKVLSYVQYLKARCRDYVCETS